MLILLCGFFFVGLVMAKDDNEIGDESGDEDGSAREPDESIEASMPSRNSGSTGLTSNKITSLLFFISFFLFNWW